MRKKNKMSKEYLEKLEKYKILKESVGGATQKEEKSEENETKKKSPETIDVEYKIKNYVHAEIPAKDSENYKKNENEKLWEENGEEKSKKTETEENETDNEKINNEEKSNETKKPEIKSRVSFFVDKIKDKRKEKREENENEELSDKIVRIVRSSSVQVCFLGIALILLLSYIYGMFGNLVQGKISASIVRNVGLAFHRSGFRKFSVFAIVGVAALSLIIKRQEGKAGNSDDRNFEFSEYDHYGTSKWMTDEEKTILLEEKDSLMEMSGLIFGIDLDTGKYVGLPVDSKLNRNIAVCGSQGSTKSASYVRNSIIQLVKNEQSVIVTDPKGEMYRDTAKYCEDNGYVVKQWNLKDLISSDSWHCLGDVDEDNINTFVDTVIRNTTDKFDHFYDNTEMDLLKALCLYIKLDEDIPKEEKTFAKAYQMILNNDVSELDAKFDALEEDNPAKQAYNLFSKADKVKGNAILGLGTRLQTLQNKKLQKVTGSEDIDLELPAKQKCAYYIITSDQESTYDVYSTLFIAYLFIKTVAFADRQQNGKTIVPIHFMFEEFPNIGEIVDFKKKLATVRGRGIGISIIFQNIPQMANRYPNNQYLEILGGCDIQLFLGCNDEMTAKYYSGKTGEGTIDVETKRKNLKTLRVTDYTSDFAQSEGLGKRLVLTPDEVMRLREPTEEDPFGQGLLWVGGSRPLKIRKAMFWTHPESKKFEKTIASQHIPKWVYDLKDKTNFKTKYGGLYEIGIIPDNFKDTFEAWEKEAQEVEAKKMEQLQLNRENKIDVSGSSIPIKRTSIENKNGAVNVKQNIISSGNQKQNVKPNQENDNDKTVNKIENDSSKENVNPMENLNLGTTMKQEENVTPTVTKFQFGAKRRSSETKTEENENKTIENQENKTKNTETRQRINQSEVSIDDVMSSLIKK